MSCIGVLRHTRCCGALEEEQNGQSDRLLPHTVRTIPAYNASMVCGRRMQAEKTASGIAVLRAEVHYDDGHSFR